MAISPRIDCERASISAASAARVSPARRSASAGRSTQTRLERLPGRGTRVNGPSSVWNSVDVSSCGTAWLRLATSAAWSYRHSRRDRCPLRRAPSSGGRRRRPPAGRKALSPVESVSAIDLVAGRRPSRQRLRGARSGAWRPPPPAPRRGRRSAMLWPKASRPISRAWKATSGARMRRRVPSTMRMVLERRRLAGDVVPDADLFQAAPPSPRAAPRCARRPAAGQGPPEPRG